MKQSISPRKIAFSALITAVGTVMGMADVENPYIIPHLEASELTNPFNDYKSDLTSNDYSTLTYLVSEAVLDQDQDGFTDLQEFLCGSDALDPTSTPEKFNLALAMAVDWDPDVTSNPTGELLTRAAQLGINLPPKYIAGLSPTLETQFHLELAQLALELEYNPAKIYKWIYENIEFEDYHLSRKGALATYRTGRGNEYDQSSLLIALLRMSGIPARYVLGHQYESVSNLTENGLPYRGENNLKDIVIVQAWLPGGAPVSFDHGDFDMGHYTWLPMVPWHKSTEAKQGIDLFDAWFGTDGSGVPPEMDVALSYLLSPETPRGTLNRDVWLNINGSAVSDLRNHPAFPLQWDFAEHISSFKVELWDGLNEPGNENFGTRIRGYIHPPADGAYTFYIAGDDNCELWLSSSADPTKKELIAHNPGWTHVDEWNRFPNKQDSEPINLKANQRFYIEAYHKEGIGGDHISVAWSGPVVGIQAIISQEYISPYTVDWTQYPNAELLNAHRQQDAVEYFEKHLQTYIGNQYPGKSVKEVPYIENIRPMHLGRLPTTLPVDLAISANSSIGNDTMITDLSEARILLGEDKRMSAEVELRTGIATLYNGLIGYWNLDNGSLTSLSGVAPAENWDGFYLNEANIAFNQGYQNTGLSLNIYDGDGDGNPDSSTAYAKLNDYVATSDERTIMMWIYVPEGVSSGTHVLYEEGNNSSGYCLRINNNKLQFGAATTTPGVPDITEADFGSDLEGKWVHVAATVSPGFTTFIYIDGVEAGGGLSLYSPNVSNSIISAAIGARSGQGIFGGSSTGDYFKGIIDEILVYDTSLVSNRVVNNIGQVILSKDDDNKLYLPQISDRRLSLDFIQLTDLTPLLQPRFLLDGYVLESATKTLMKTTPTSDLTTGNSFHVNYRLKGDVAWKRRPLIRSGAMMTFCFDGLNASSNRINELKSELQGLPTNNVLSDDSLVRETYVGRMGSLLAETFNYRVVNARQRMDELLGVGRLIGEQSRHFTMIWTFPDDPSGISSTGEGQIDNASALRLAAGWRIDANAGTVPIYNARQPGEVYHPTDKPSRFLTTIYGNASSYNEARIFEDWQGTPALSTISGIFSAIESADNEILFFSGNESDAKVRESLQIDRHEDTIVELVTQGSINILSASRTNGVISLTLSSTDGLKVGDTIKVFGLYGDDIPSGEFSIIGVNGSIITFIDNGANETFTLANAIVKDTKNLNLVIAPFNNVEIYYPFTIEVLSGSRTNNVVTLTVPSTAGLVSGDRVTVVGITGFTANNNPNGDFDINVIDDTTLSYGHSGANDTFDINTGYVRKIAVQSDVYFSSTRTGVSYKFGDFDGGQSDEEIDEEERIDIITDTNGLDFTGTNRLLLEQATASGAAEDVMNACLDPQTARAVYLGGDPVDLVTGEFYFQEPADIQVRARAGSLNIVRKYESQAIYDGPFGFGWTWNHGESLLFVKRQDDPSLTDIVFYNSERTPICFRQAITGAQTGSITFANETAATISAENIGAFSIFRPGDTITVTRSASNNGNYTIESIDDTYTRLTLMASNSLISETHSDVTLALTNGTFRPPLGATLTLQIIDDGGADRYALSTKTKNTLLFELDGRLHSKRDTLGNGFDYTYDAYSRMATIQDTSGQTLEFVYNNNNKVIQVTDFTGRSVYYSYSDDDLVAFEDLAGNVWQYEYLTDQENPLNNHNLSKIILPDSDYLEIFYYKNDTVSHHRNKQGSEYHFQYSWYNRYTETWTEEGYYQKIFYNDRWDVTRIQTQDKTVEFREYDFNHNMTALVDGRGNRTIYRYDDRRNLVAVINPLGETWVYGYEPTFNRKVVEIDPRGTVSLFKYTEKGQLEKAVAATEVLGSPITFDANGLPVYDLRVSIHADGNLVDDGIPAVNTLLDYPERGEIRFTYDVFGNLLTKTQVLTPANGANPEVTIETENVFDIYGLNRVKAIDARDNETAYFYDDLNRIVAVQDSAGYVTQTTYTPFDAIQKMVTADGAITEYFYNDNRRLARTVLPNGGEVKTKYGSRFYVDHVDRVLQEIDPLGYSVIHEYDKAGRRIATTDKNGNTTRFKYDEENRLIETRNAMGDSMRYTYDGNGNRISITDFRGNTVLCEFDAANRKTLRYETWGDKRAVQYAYDSNSNRTHVRRGYMNDATFVLLDGTEHVYNRRNHLIKTMPNVQPNPNARRNIWYGYDSLGRRTVVQEGGMQETAPGSGTYFETTLRSTVTGYDSNDNPTTSITYQGEADTPNTWTEINRTERLYESRNLVSQSIDPNGTPTTYTYDPLGRMLTSTTHITDSDNNAVPHITDVTFDTMGNQVLVKSIVGTTEVGRNEYGYNLRNERVRHENALGYVHSFAFDGNGNVIEATDPAGNVTRTYFDALNRVSANENALGHTTRRAYDANSNLVATISPLNERTTFEYNENNELITTIDPVGNTTRYYFDKRGRQLLIQSPRHPGGIVDPYVDPPALWTTRTDYNAFDEPFMVRTPVTLVDDSVVIVQTSSLFDALGRVVSVTDARGTITETDYDALDRVVEIRQAPGQPEETVTRNYFDSNGNRLLSIRAFGTPEQVATYTRFDEANRAVESTIGALQLDFDPMTVNHTTDTPASIFKANEFLTTTTAYFDNERRVAVADPYGMTSSTVTDALGRIVSATDKAGYTTRFFYDSRNNLVQTQFPNGSPDAPIINSYDALNRVVSTSQAGDISFRKFDASQRLIEETDARGYVTRHVYDKASRLIRTTRAVGTPEQAITKFAYDAANNRTAIIDANHSLAYAPGVTANEIPIASYEFDELNRVVREWDASGNTGSTDGEISYYLDNGGLPIATYKRDGLVVGRLFDKLGRQTLIQTEYQNNPPVIQQEFKYDALSRMTDGTDYNAHFMTGVSSAEHTVSYTYDFASRITDELMYDSDLHNPIAGRTVSTTWGIAPASELSQYITKSYPYGNRGQTRKLDERGQLRFIEDFSAVQIAAFDYDSMSRPNSSEIRNASSVSVMTGSANFDNRGRELSRSVSKGSTLFLNQTVAYDGNSNIEDETLLGTVPIVTGFKDYTLDPLNRLTNQDNPGAMPDLNWTLDLEGNWLSTNQNGVTESRGHNDDNEIINLGVEAITYSPNGNITRKGNLGFIYDWAERITQVINHSAGGAIIATYSYDAANRRITKTHQGVTTTFIYDGAQVVQELEQSSLARTFIYGSYIDAPVVMYDEQNLGAQYFYVRDRRANVIGLLDSNSNIVERMEYSPFGTWTVYNAAGVEITGSTVGNPYGFTGRRWNSESSLWYYRNRIYSAELGRFLSRDPAGFVDGFHLYNYVSNNPLRYVDPLGLMRIEEIQALQDRMRVISDRADILSGNKPEIHHIATDKDRTFGRAFRDMFKRAGMDLEHPLNKIEIAGHKGPHGHYNRIIFERLREATNGVPKGSPLYGVKFRAELMKIRGELMDVNSPLRGLIQLRSPSFGSKIGSLARRGGRALGYAGLAVTAGFYAKDVQAEGFELATTHLYVDSVISNVEMAMAAHPSIHTQVNLMQNFGVLPQTSALREPLTNGIRNLIHGNGFETAVSPEVLAFEANHATEIHGGGVSSPLSQITNSMIFSSSGMAPVYNSDGGITGYGLVDSSMGFISSSGVGGSSSYFYNESMSGVLPASGVNRFPGTSGLGPSGVPLIEAANGPFQSPSDIVSGWSFTSQYEGGQFGVPGSGEMTSMNITLFLSIGGNSMSMSTNGGQSAAFVDRSRYSSSNSRLVMGSAIHTGRPEMPENVNLSARLFR